MWTPTRGSNVRRTCHRRIAWLRSSSPSPAELQREAAMGAWEWCRVQAQLNRSCVGAGSGAWVGSFTCVVERVPTTVSSHTRRASRQIWSPFPAYSCFHRFIIQIDRFISIFDRFIGQNWFLNLSNLTFEFEPILINFTDFHDFLLNRWDRFWTHTDFWIIDGNLDFSMIQLYHPEFL
jgi:hypothetical protein